MVPTLSILALAGAAIACLVAGGALRLAQASTPAKLLAQVQSLQEQVETFRLNDEGRDLRITGNMEALDQLVETVEKKRRQTAASAAKLERESGALNGSPGSVEEATARFRAMGLDV